MSQLPIELPRGPLMIDITGTALTDLDRERLCHPLVGGIILGVEPVLHQNSIREYRRCCKADCAGFPYSA